MQIRVDRELCTGHALCHDQAPELFVLDELGFNTTETQVVPPELWQQARRGALACPECAITIEE